MNDDYMEDKYQSLDWFDDQDEITKLAISDAISLELNSYDELVSKDDYIFTKLIKSYKSFNQNQLHGAIGYIQVENNLFVLILDSAHGEFEGADAIEICIDNNITNSDLFTITSTFHDCFEIRARNPLVITSMYGAIFGFKKLSDGIHHVFICDGDSGWD